MSWLIYFKKYIYMGVFVFDIPEFTIFFVSPEMIDLYFGKPLTSKSVWVGLPIVQIQLFPPVGDFLEMILSIYDFF